MLRPHAADPIALVAGTIFAGFTAVWLLIVTDVIDIEQAWLGGPAILIVSGVLGLAVALTPNRDRDRWDPAPAAAAADEQPTPLVDVRAPYDSEASIDTDAEPTAVLTDESDETELPDPPADPGDQTRSQDVS